MGGTGVIDRFLEVFTRYIDSGFGLLNGEVAFLATTLAAIDITLAAIFWSWAAEEDIIARLAKKTLFVGVFAYLISNWNNLARIVFESFSGLGLKASGTGMSTADFLSPGALRKSKSMLAARSWTDLRFFGLHQLFRKLRSDRSLAIRLDHGAARILHFGDPALCDADRVQADDVGGFCADPLWSVRQDCVCRRARPRQRYLLGCQGPGPRRDRWHRFDLVLAVHRGIRRQPAHHRRCHVHGAGGTVPARARHLRSWDRQRHCGPGGPQLGAGAAVRTGLAAGGVVAAGVAGAGLAAGAVGGVLAGAARGGASVAAAASNVVGPGRRAASEAASNASGAGQGGASAATSSPSEPPAWARRMKRSQTVSYGASAATNAVRSGDHGGGGASVSIFPKASADVQTTFRAIRPNACARNPLSIRRQRKSGRSDRLRSNPGEQFLSLTAFGSLLLSAGLASALVWQSVRGTVTPWVVQVDRLGEAQAVAPAVTAAINRPIRRSRFTSRASSRM